MRRTTDETQTSRPARSKASKKGKERGGHHCPKTKQSQTTIYYRPHTYATPHTARQRCHQDGRTVGLCLVAVRLCRETRRAGKDGQQGTLLPQASLLGRTTTRGLRVGGDERDETPKSRLDRLSCSRERESLSYLRGECAGVGERRVCVA